MKRKLFILFIPAVFIALSAQAQEILILNDAQTQDSIMTILTDAGLTVEDGGPYWQFTDRDISGFSLVILLNGVAWTNAVPQAGQDNLRQFIFNGGMMLSTEWISWSGATNQTLNSIIPVRYGGSWSTGSETYTVMAEHPITDNLPEEFIVPSNWSFSVTDRKTDATLNAVTLIRGSRSRDAVVIGDYGNGSIVHWNMGGQYSGRNIWSDEVRQLLINIAEHMTPSTQVVLQFPVNHATYISLSPTFGWRTLAGADYYEFQLATDEEFTELVADRVYSDSTPVVLEDSLELNTTYFWRVRGSIDGTLRNWSRTWTFSTQVPTTAEHSDEPTEFRLYSNYPNPFNPATTIRYDLPTAAHVQIEIFDTLGRKLRTLVDGQQAAGRHDISFDASGLSGGIYIYRLRAGDFTDAGTMLLVK